MRPRLLRALVGAALAVAGASCIRDPEMVTPVAAIRIDGESAIDVGDSTTLRAIAFDAHGLAIRGVTFKWRSEFPDVATVTGSGVVRGLRGGSTEIVARGGGMEQRLNVVVNAVGASITITPPATTVALGALQQFDAGVRGTASPAVAWSVEGVAGGNATVGTISASGIYRAPSVMPTSNPVTIRAVLVADPAVRDSAVVTLVGAAARAAGPR